MFFLSLDPFLPYVRAHSSHISPLKGLVSADVNGLSDPYVSVSLAGVTATTRVVEKTLNPIFFEEVRPESAQSRAQSRAQS